MLLPGIMLVHVRSTPLTLGLLLFVTLGFAARLAASPAVQVTPAGLTAGTSLSRLHTSPMLQALMGRMAERSPSFARLCARLERARGLHLRMRLAAPARHGRYVARSIITRYEYGAIVAEITLHTPPDLVETIAHELEHVLEQVERVDLQRLSRAKGSGVSRMWSGDYETDRAVAAGRRVAAEFYDRSSERAAMAGEF